MGTIFCDPTHINLNTQRTIAKFHVARTLKHASAASQESPFSMSPLPTILHKSMPSMAIAFLLLTNSGIGLRAGLRFYLGQTRSEPEFWLRLVYPFIFWIYSRIDRHRCTDDVEPKAIPFIRSSCRALIEGGYIALPCRRSFRDFVPPSQTLHLLRHNLHYIAIQILRKSIPTIKSTTPLHHNCK